MLRSSAGCMPDCLAKRVRALERLDHEVVGDVAREAEVDGGVDERLHDQEDVGRAGPGDGRGHRHHLLVVDLELVPEGAEQGGGLGALLGRAVSGVAYQTVMPLPRRAGVLGMLRTTWSWPRIPVRAAVVAPARTLRTSWPRRRCGPISRPTLPSIWGLIPNRMTSAPSTASTLLATVRIAVRRARGARAAPARGWLATIWSGSTSPPRSMPGDHRLGHDAGTDGRDRGLRQGGHRRGV